MRHLRKEYDEVGTNIFNKLYIVRGNAAGNVISRRAAQRAARQGGTFNKPYIFYFRPPRLCRGGRGKGDKR